MTPSEFSLVGERIWNQIHTFNVREGFLRKTATIATSKDIQRTTDFGHSQRKNPSQGKESTKKMLDDYYGLRGWDLKTGYPAEQTLKRLGLEDVSRSLEYTWVSSAKVTTPQTFPPLVNSLKDKT